MLFIIIAILCWPVALVVAAGYLLFWTVLGLIWFCGALFTATAYVIAGLVALWGAYRTRRVAQ